MVDRSEQKTRAVVARLAAILFWVAVWFVAAQWVDNDVLLAGPGATLATLVADVQSPAFWSAVGVSGARIVAACAVSALAGVVLGFAGARFRLVGVLLAPVIQVMKTAPVACVVVILLVMVGSHGAVAVIVAFVALPPFYVAAHDASAVRNRDFERVLRLAGATRWHVFLMCTWPTALPYFQAAAKTAVGLSWRAGVTGELLGIPLGSIGAAVYASKLTLDAAGLLAWTIAIMVLGWICERAVVALLALSGKSPCFALGARSRVANRCTAAPMPRAAALRLRGVSKAYGDAQVLGQVDLAVEPGERCCLMAPTGSGKTTLLRVLLGFEPADAGVVERPRRCGVVLQGACLAEDLSALDNVLAVAAFDRSRTCIRAELEALLPPDCVDKPASALSGGTRRLVELARALFSAGEAVVLDEPFAGLDARTRERACVFVRAHLGNRPLVVATHDARDAALLDARIEKRA